MCGSVCVQSPPPGPLNTSLTLLLSLATAHSLFNAAGKSSSASMGTLKRDLAERCWSTVSRKKVQVRKRDTSVLRSS